MKTILSYFRSHFQSGLSLRAHVLTACCIAALFTVNYSIDLENSILNPLIGSPDAFFWFFLMYGGTYLSVLLVQAAVMDRWQPLKSRRFWFLIVVFMALLTLNSSTYFYVEWIGEVEWESLAWKHFTYKSLLYGGNALVWLFPIMLIKRFADRNEGFGLYGLSSVGLHLRPYLTLLTGMTPLIIWASFQPDFLLVYPTFPGRELPVGGIVLHEFISLLFYDVFYASNFIGVELYFRGLLVIGLAKYLGRDAILPMVALYGVLHFGKPLGEAIGSVFGGYILGVIALYGRNIWGGALVHMGIALLMEWAAIWQKTQGA